ncbi:MAG: four helix bundle protein [Bacteroidia bacterium]
MGKHVFREKSFGFAIKVVKVCKLLSSEQKEFVLSKQLLRSATAIGALHREAEHGESKADFIHKMGIAQKECNETVYWLELLHATEYLTEMSFNELHKEASELLRLCTAIIKTAKQNKQTTNH